MPTDGFGITLTGAATGAIGKLINGVPPGILRTKLDTTTHDNANGDETSQPSTRKGVPDTTFTLQYDKTETAALYTAMAAAIEVWTFVDADSNSWACSGYIIELGTDAIETDAIVTQTITMGWSGAVTYTPA